MLEKYWFWILLVLVVFFAWPQIKAFWIKTKTWFAARRTAAQATVTPIVPATTRTINWKAIIFVILVILLLCHGYQKNWYGLFSKKQTVAVLDKQPNTDKSKPDSPVTPPPVTVETKVVEKQIPVVIVKEVKTVETKIVTIKGEDGKDGDKGEKGDKGEPGEKGDQGQPGTTQPPKETEPPEEQTPPPQTDPETPKTELTCSEKSAAADAKYSNIPDENKTLAQWEEILCIPLDQFGWRVEKGDDDTFAIGGENFDMSLHPGDMVFSNSFFTVVQNDNVIFQKGKNILYRKAVAEERVRFTGYDGHWFIIRKGKDISERQGIAAMAITVLKFHNGTPGTVYGSLKLQFVELKPWTASSSAFFAPNFNTAI